MFSSALLDWYSDHARKLPWRGIDDPYRIWLSEIILQQTRIEQGMAYYHHFVEHYPTVAHLAAASEEQVLKSWQGLGYYSRARNLQAAAQYIANELGGVFPSTYEEILKLKGVGKYTAAAIASFAFHIPVPVIDGNVYRFISRLYAISTPINSTSAYKEFEILLNKLIDPTQPHLFNQALMDFGSIHCVPKNPDCPNCPFRNECEAHKRNTVDLFPVKAAPREAKERWFYYFQIQYTQGRHTYTFMQQRTQADIWKGLYEFPRIESDHPLTPHELEQQRHALFRSLGIPSADSTREQPVTLTHKLTHRTIYAHFYQYFLPAHHSPKDFFAPSYSTSQLKKLPVSRLIDKYLTSETE